MISTDMLEYRFLIVEQKDLLAFNNAIFVYEILLYVFPMLKPTLLISEHVRGHGGLAEEATE
jgi:hypothetical protein